MEYEQVEINSERWFDLTPLLNEEFRDIECYEGIYQISNYGRVKSLKRYKKNNSKFQMVNEIIKKAYLNNNGYYYVTLNKNNHSKHIYLHRMIAKAFIPNPNNYPCINHKDGNKINNNINNLEFCSYSHNNKEAYRMGLKIGSSVGKLGYNNWHSKEVYQYDLEGNLVSKYGGASEAYRKTKINACSIRDCCRGEQKTAGGYIWRYESEVVNNE